MQRSDEEAAQARPAGGPEFWIPVAAAVLALLAAGAQIPGRGEFCLDDAWIHQAYARSLRLGDGLSYNPGDLETGFSSPLWVALLAVWPRAPDPVLPTKLLGALLHAGTAYLAALYAAGLARRRATLEAPVPVASVSAMAGVAVAFTPALVQGASSGMEVPLAALTLLGALLAADRGADGGAAILGACAVWSRPEALLALGPFSLGLWALRRDRGALAPAAGGVAALALWVGYCLAVSGYPWPNTRYVKAGAGGLDGLHYLVAEVLLEEPWCVGVGGAVLLVLALAGAWRARARGGLELAVLVGAWAAAMLGTALSRPLHPGVLFFEARYFAIFAPLPVVAWSMGLAGARRWYLLLLALPVALATSLGLAATTARQRAQEESVARLHTRPAQWLIGRTAAGAVIGVEGAGAHRFRAPRDRVIVDLLGLNDARIAHAEDTAAQVCAIMERSPQYLVGPSAIIEPLSRAFRGRVIAEFPDPSFGQVRAPHPVTVLVVEVAEPRETWRHRCEALSSDVPAR